MKSIGMTTATGGRSRATVGKILKTVFPNGTILRSDAPENDAAQTGGIEDFWSALPPFPTDVFAFCAYVIEMTGLMGQFDPNPDAKSSFEDERFLSVVLSADERKECKVEADKWRKEGLPGKLVKSLWNDLQKARDDHVRVRAYQRDHRSTAVDNGSAYSGGVFWWNSIFKLLIIADEACDGIGHSFGGDETPFQKFLNVRLSLARTRESQLNGSLNSAESHEHYVEWVKARHQVSTLAVAADPAVVCVQPKGRVSQLGCSLRNISRNLAFTGPVGSVRCSWQQLAKTTHDTNNESLNVLVIPLPFNIEAPWFSPLGDLKSDGAWGSFRLNQGWLKPVEGANEEAFTDKICAFVRELILEAQLDAPNVNAVIFPEYALNYNLFERLMAEVHMATNGRIEFMIAGSSINCEDDSGNCVLTAIWEHNVGGNDENTGNEPTWVRVISQQKHHRWKLEESQIRTYGLGGSLTPFTSWWEEHSIGMRELSFFQFRRNAVFASLICEDLARNDPCHQIIRSVAPNLIVALLLDGPQTESRWSARYAGSLADDPGSAVLTLTSYGMIKRCAEHSDYPKDNSIGLLRDDTGRTRKLELPDDAHALLLTLAPKEIVDYTIDGRSTTNATSWRFVNQHAIKAATDPWNIRAIDSEKAS